uniref:(California timema) hypothetical protein n=1 Tax=Timema californicum TaxID=61474 RepID=A0A7R9JAI2_TIMCA|nr:unnamed protein product [Timema californicum]
MEKKHFRGSTPAFSYKESEEKVGKTTVSRLVRDSSPDLPGISRRVHHEGDALAHSATESDFLHALVRLRDQYGPIIRLWLGPELFVFITDPKYVEVILSSNKLLDKGNNYKYLNSWIGNGLLTSSGTKWRTHRKIITPTFHFSILEDFLDIFNANGRKLVEKLQKEVNGPEFDLYPYVTLCALDIICGEKYDNKDETAMGIKINAQDGGSADFVEATRGR